MSRPRGANMYWLVASKREDKREDKWEDKPGHRETGQAGAPGDRRHGPG